MDQKEYLKTLFNQLLRPSSVPIVTKTPKISRKRILEHIETIPENEVLKQKNVEDVQTFPEKEKDSDKVVRRTRRIASLKAVDNITKQIQDLHNTRPTKSNNENVSFSEKKGKRKSKLKRNKSAQNSSDKNENEVPSRYSLGKVEVDKENKKEPEKRIKRKMTEQPVQTNKGIIEKIKEQNSFQKLPRFSKSESEECQKKESVKKRVEAFEQQVVMQSPKSVDVNEPTRIIRTKTCTMAAAEVEAETKNTDKYYTQILACKSLAKAKKIACFAEKQKKDNEESKENKEQIPERINKLTKNDRLNAMPQLKTTPLNKPKLVTPMSVTHLQTPSSTHKIL